MRPEQWDTFKRAARLEKLDKVPMALIVDSPWIPGYLGIKHMDYYLDPELWFQSNLKIMREYPDVIMVPSWWMEYGMAAEPSVLGAKIKFWQDNTPSEYHTLYRLEDIDQFPEYEVEADAFAAMTLHRIGMHKQRILDHGYILPMVTSRGPLCTAGFVRSTTNLMIELVENPEGCHKLIDLCTRVIIDWLKAQHKVMGDTVEGIFILDDIVGFINEEHYQEFAHPYLKRICDAFPADWVKVYHNDAEVDACLDHLPDAGFNVLNWGKQKDIREVKQRVGKRMCLMGNVNPLEIAVRGTPDGSPCRHARRARGLRRGRDHPLGRRRRQSGHAGRERAGDARGSRDVQRASRLTTRISRRPCTSAAPAHSEYTNGVFATRVCDDRPRRRRRRAVRPRRWADLTAQAAQVANEDGYKLWLRFAPPGESATRYRQALRQVVVEGDSPTMRIIRDELTAGTRQCSAPRYLSSDKT